MGQLYHGYVSHNQRVNIHEINHPTIRVPVRKPLVTPMKKRTWRHGELPH
jgi:hypothetical protein